MPSALYYPHTTISDPGILKSALLLWDSIECIAPSFGKRQHWFDDERLNEATELVVRDHIPTAGERKKVHDRVADLLSHGVPEWFRIIDEGRKRKIGAYSIYGDKLSAETWRLLEDHSLSIFRDGDGLVSEPLGLLIMSLLADACAGSMKRRITDRIDAYSKLNSFLCACAGGGPIEHFDESHDSGNYEELIGISFRVLDADAIPIQALLDLRSREARESGTDLSQFRRRYADKISEAISDLAAHATVEADRVEILKDFEWQMRDDLFDLKRELGSSVTKALTTRDVVITAITLMGSVASILAGHTATGAVGGLLQTPRLAALIKTKSEYASAKRKALRNHAMSWLYVADASSH